MRWEQTCYADYVGMRPLGAIKMPGRQPDSWVSWAHNENTVSPSRIFRIY